MKSPISLLLFFALVATGPVARESGPNGSAQDRAAPALLSCDDPDLKPFAWLVGSWAGKEGETQMEEHWTHACGGVMLGIHRDVSPSRRTFFEYLRIEKTPEGIVYWASPRGRTATPFRLTENEEGKAVFENPEHDYPQRIIYSRGPDGTLRARIEGTENGRFRASEWHWQRARLATE